MIISYFFFVNASETIIFRYSRASFRSYKSCASLGIIHYIPGTERRPSVNNVIIVGRYIRDIMIVQQPNCPSVDCQCLINRPAASLSRSSTCASCNSLWKYQTRCTKALMQHRWTRVPTSGNCSNIIGSTRFVRFIPFRNGGFRIACTMISVLWCFDAFWGNA